MCEDERGKAGRRPGDPATAAPGALLMFKPHAKPLSAEGVGKYAIKFSLERWPRTGHLFLAVSA